MSAPTYPINRSANVKLLAAKAVELLTDAQLGDLRSLIAEDQARGGPSHYDAVAPTELFTDAQLAADATAIAAGEDFAAALVLAGWTAPE